MPQRTRRAAFVSSARRKSGTGTGLTSDLGQTGMLQSTGSCHPAGHLQAQLWTTRTILVPGEGRKHSASAAPATAPLPSRPRFRVETVTRIRGLDA
ncbi:hypothetical protein GCM10010462_07960 [Microbacterium dextranolyticum]